MFLEGVFSLSFIVLPRPLSYAIVYIPTRIGLSQHRPLGYTDKAGMLSVDGGHTDAVMDTINLDGECGKRYCLEADGFQPPRVVKSM